MKLFDAEARQQIEAVVAEVEQRTAAEIAVVVVPASDSYHDLRLLYAAACALASATVVHVLWPRLAFSVLLWLELLVACSLYWALSWKVLLRWVLPPLRARHSVERHAREAFLLHEVFATRGRTGVLLLISELERCAVILGDTAIHARVQEHGWQAQMNQLIAAIRGGRAAAGTCDLIRAVGAVLAEDLPVTADDQNELSNTVHDDQR